jgi:phage gp36-like protein
MPYCTLDDIKKLIPEEALAQLTDDEGLGSVNPARVDEAIAQADAEINSYCGGRYAVPFSMVPDIVKKLSVDIVLYNLYSRRVEEAPAIRAERYKNAIRQLEGISKGVISLGVDPAPSASADGRAETNKPTDDNVFSREKLEGF